MIIKEVHQADGDIDELIDILKGEKQTVVPIRRTYAIDLLQEVEQKRGALDWIAETISGWKSSGYIQFGKWAQEDGEFETLWRLLDLLVPFEDEISPAPADAHLGADWRK